ncbi:hypothetical protein AB0910_13715 [Streptomyces sp. NPDC047002]|uniref:hypothetical protein n=1 Tax=Streptomyces sp. NPDC047002 TaxID=3155475 RepID=UPI003455D7C9
MAIMSLDPTGTGQARRTMRWKTALNAFDITFDGRLSATCRRPNYPGSVSGRRGRGTAPARVGAVQRRVRAGRGPLPIAGPGMRPQFPPAAP